MLTLRKITVASGDWAAARRAAHYPLAFADSPEAFAAAEDGVPCDPCRQPTAHAARWLGTSSMLDRLGVDDGAGVSVKELSLVLQGRNAVSGERVRREGLIHRRVRTADGRKEVVRVRGTKSVDLTFSAPKSVSVIWSEASAELRRGIEDAMLASADAMLRWLTRTKPVVAHQRALVEARGFAAAAALHVRARAAAAETVPAPQLHVHALLVGVERPDGFFAAPELSGLFMHGAPLEGAAVGRAKLAELLVDLGFAIERQTGRESRFFEIQGVPHELAARMSARTADVEEGIRRREAGTGRSLTGRERAVVALRTRAPKATETTAEQTAEIWHAAARAFCFGSRQIEALRTGRGFGGQLADRRRAVRLGVARRIRERPAAGSRGERDALVFEQAAGLLSLHEAEQLFAELRATGALDPRPTSTGERSGQGDRERPQSAPHHG